MALKWLISLDMARNTGNLSSEDNGPLSTTWSRPVGEKIDGILEAKLTYVWRVVLSYVAALFAGDVG